MMSEPTSRPFAEMAEWSAWGGGPCVVLAQGSKDNLVGTVMARVEGGPVSQIDMCVAPSPYTATRTGEYPS